MTKSIGLMICGVFALGLGMGACVHNSPQAIGGGPILHGYEGSAIGTDMSTGEHGRPRHRGVKAQNGQGVVIGQGLGAASSSGDDVFGY